MLSLTHTHLDQRSLYSVGRVKRLSTRAQHGGSHRSYHRPIRSQYLYEHGSRWPIHRLQVGGQPIVVARATTQTEASQMSAQSHRVATVLADGSIGLHRYQGIALCSILIAESGATGKLYRARSLHSISL